MKRFRADLYQELSSNDMMAFCPRRKEFLLPVLFLLVFLLDSNAQFSLNIETTYLPDYTRLARVMDDTGLRAELGRYGGWLGYREEETGYFYTKKINGAWYIIDPEGYLFYSVGINSVTKGGGFILPDSLLHISCNTMGCWSDESINTNASQKIAYTPRWNMMLNYKNTSDRTKNLYENGIIPVFDPQFATFCLDLAYNDIAPLKNDPYILGHFSDNELPVYDNSTYGFLLDRFLNIQDKMDPNYLAANNWMIQRKGSGYSIDDTDRLDFHGYLMATYYSIVNTAIKKYDPNHLYLGSRLHGAAKFIEPIFREAGKYVDIISLNVYGIWTLSEGDMNLWSEVSGKPFLVTEFYAKAVDSGLPNTDGAGWLVNTQQDRSFFFENFTLALLTHPGSVGYHHFRYIDKEGINAGLVDMTYSWYVPLKESFDKVGKDIYRLREFMLYGYTGNGAGSIYTGSNYQDRARLLDPGYYSMNDLTKLGIPDNSIASVRIKPGYVMTLYSDDNFSGDSLFVNGQIASLSQAGFGAITSSLKIEAVTSEINDKTTSPFLNIYPVPASNYLVIDLFNVEGEIQFTIFSTSGQAMKQGILNCGTFWIDLSGLEEGIYFLQTRSEEICFNKIFTILD